MQDKLPLIIAHRGGKFWESNDFSYISESVRDGADVIELDIRLKSGEYIVQHSPLDKIQGRLADALKRIENARLYLDIKDKSIDINALIAWVKSNYSNQIIVGSFNEKILTGIESPDVIKALHCFWPWDAVQKGRQANANWLIPLCYIVTEDLAKNIQLAGFKFVPGGNAIFKKHEMMGNQLRYAAYGAHAIAAYHVKKMRELILQLEQKFLVR